jgi:hypothetical protein
MIKLLAVYAPRQSARRMGMVANIGVSDYLTLMTLNVTPS